MNCDRARELLAGYVLEALEPRERRAVARHLERCAGRARLAAGLVATAHELPALLELLDARELPDSILERLDRRAGSGREDAPPARSLTPSEAKHVRLPGGSLRARLAVAAVIAAAAIAVAATVRSQQAVAGEDQLRERVTALIGEQSVVFDVVDSPKTTKFLLLAAGKDSHAYGKVYTRVDTREAVAFVNELPQPPGGERYMLWIRDRRTTTLTGMFSLRHGFGYLVFSRSGQSRPGGAFVTLQAGTKAPAGTKVLEISQP